MRREKILADAKASEAEATELQRQEAAAAGPNAPRPDFAIQMAAEALGFGKNTKG